MPRVRIDNLESLKRYAVIYARKVAFVALSWVVVYFVFQFMRRVPANGMVNISTLFALLVGAAAGLVSGWYLATDSVEDSSMQGLPLWCVLVAGAALPMWIVEAILKALTHWPMNFGGYMMLTAATVMALATAVWIESAQE
jgi:hypothetical protein